MRLVQGDNVVEALAPNRSDQPCGKTVLPRRRWYDRPVPNAHGVQSARNDGAIDAIPIADEVAWRLIPWECLRYLAHDPFGCWICCDEAASFRIDALIWQRSRRAHRFDTRVQASEPFPLDQYPQLGALALVNENYKPSVSAVKRPLAMFLSFDGTSHLILRRTELMISVATTKLMNFTSNKRRTSRASAKGMNCQTA